MQEAARGDSPAHSLSIHRLSVAQYDAMGRAGILSSDDRVELLKHKSLHAGRTWEPAEWLHTKQALEEVRDAWREMTTLNVWLADNVGASSKEPRRR